MCSIFLEITKIIFVVTSAVNTRDQKSNLYPFPETFTCATDGADE